MNINPNIPDSPKGMRRGYGGSLEPDPYDTPPTWAKAADTDGSTHVGSDLENTTWDLSPTDHGILLRRCSACRKVLPSGWPKLDHPLHPRAGETDRSLLYTCPHTECRHQGILRDFPKCDPSLEPAPLPSVLLGDDPTELGLPGKPSSLPPAPGPQLLDPRAIDSIPGRRLGDKKDLRY
jgi:hypothetical protein